VTRSNLETLLKQSEHRVRTKEAQIDRLLTKFEAMVRGRRNKPRGGWIVTTSCRRETGSKLFRHGPVSQCSHNTLIRNHACMLRVQVRRVIGDASGCLTRRVCPYPLVGTRSWLTRPLLCVVLP
jgi:hypothetical protein